MLTMLRKSAGGIVIKGFLLFLVLTFVVWGIGDIFRGSSNPVIAEVGDQAVSLQSYNTSLQNELSRLQQLMGGVRLSEEQIRAFGIRHNTLNRLIDRELMVQDIKNIGIEVGPSVAAREVMKNPYFADETGKFNKERFKFFLHSNSISEAKYLTLMQQDLALEFFLDSLTQVPLISKTLLDKLYAYQQEKRSVRLVTIPKEFIKSDITPTEADLVQFHQDHSRDFTLPESRSFTLLTFDIEDAQKDITIDELTLKEMYEERKGDFMIPEMRTIDNILFDTKEEAEQAYSKLKNTSENFYTIAARITDMQKEDIHMQDVTRGGLLTSLQEPVFAANEGDFLPIIETGLGFHVIRLVHITPSSTIPFAQAREELERQLIEEEASEQLYSLSEQVEDLLLEGKSLTEIAAAFGLPLHSVSDVTLENPKSLDSIPLAIVQSGLLNLVFATDEHENSNIQLLNNNSGYFVIHVDNVKAERIQALDEVKGIVTKRFKEAEYIKQTKQFVSGIVDKMRQGTSLEEIAKKHRLKISKPIDIKRQSEKGVSAHTLPNALRVAIFMLQSNGVTDAVENTKGDLVIAKLLTIDPLGAIHENEAYRMLKQELEEAHKQDVMEQYNYYLRKQYPVTVHYDLLSRVDE